MNKLVTYLSLGVSVFALVYGFKQSIHTSTIVCLCCIIIIAIGFKVEAYIKRHGNNLLNKVLYFFEKNEKKYNVLNKHVVYSYLGNDEYLFEKHYKILPRVSDLDTVSDRYNWTAPSVGCIISATEVGHTISAIRQQELWTCYNIQFNNIPQQYEPYNVGSVISNLKDPSHSAIPCLSNTIDKKTKSTTLVVKLPKDNHPETAKFQCYSTKSIMEPSHEEILEYDVSIEGFKRTVPYPRKGWRYVITWAK